MPLLALLLAIVALPRPASALPTPDVLVASAAGAAQLLAAVSLSAGCLLWRFRRFVPSRRVLGWLAAATVAGCLLLSAGLAARLEKASASEARDWPTMDQNEAEEAVDPHGLDTAAAEALLRDPAHGGRLLLDVRERPELRAGSVPGFVPLRLPDMAARGIGAGARVLVSCWTGMRGSDVCNKLGEAGVDCRFIRGGLEKWSKEGRPMAIPRGADPDLLGTSGYYRNAGVSVSEDEARVLSEQGGALIDPRPAALWRKGHYPGAVNLPMIDLPLPELDAALAALPKGPLSVVCSGEISCALADDLGAEIAAAGGNFRGVFSTRPSALTAVTSPIARFRSAFGEAVDGLVGAAVAKGCPPWLLLVALALAARAVVQPVIRGMSANGRATTAAKRAVADTGDGRVDATTARRRMAALSERHGFRFRHAVGGLFLVPVMGVGTSLAASVSKAAHSGLLWVHDIGGRDGTAALPALAVAAFAATMWLSSRANRVSKTATLVAVLPFAAWMCFRLTAGANLYLALTAAPISLGAAASALAALRARAARRRAAAAGLLPLADAALVLPDAGKAGRLAHLARDGFPVPPGFVVLRPDVGRKEIAALAKRLGPCAVRSSAPSEDGAAASQAGMFETMLDVPSERVAQAVAAVFRAQGDRGEVLVQRMVAGDLFGVMFTRHPDAGGKMLIEAAEGADAVTGGSGASLSVEVPRPLPARAAGQGRLADPAPLAKLGLSLEDRYGTAQDVEWAMESGAPVLLQTRAVTRLLGAPEDESAPVRVAEAEIDRVSRLLEAGRGPFAQDDAAGLLPRPTPLSVDLLNRLWGHGGSVDLACRALGVRYDWKAGDNPAYAILFGRVYRTGDGPGLALPSRPSATAARRIAHAAEAAWEAFLPGFRRRMELLEATDPARLTDAALREALARVLEDFCGPDHAAAEAVNLAAVVACSASGEEGAAASLEARVWGSLSGGGEREARFRERFAWRAPHDYELSCPRYGEPGAEALLPPVEADSGREGRGGAQPAHARLLELREDSRHEVFREVALLRRLVLEAGRRLGIPDVFHLTFAELLAADPPPAALAARRRRAAEALLLRDAPTVIDAASLHGAERPGAGGGAWLSGGGPFSGPAVVLGDGQMPDGLPTGAVVVGRALSPRQVARCGGAAGIVVAVGSRLSHAAIQARELGVPMLVHAGAASAENGATVSVDADGQATFTTHGEPR
jgi:rhodanese-related sulfurtransferase/phosphohistidine swiveling domain-containing protein